jgi:hypothetical protein
MEILIFFAFIAALILLDILAVRYGADSRTNRTRPEI